jgi:ABC-type spermidine/putrescine transport system permease subunit II
MIVPVIVTAVAVLFAVMQFRSNAGRPFVIATWILLAAAFVAVTLLKATNVPAPPLARAALVLPALVTFALSVRRGEVRLFPRG